MSFDNVMYDMDSNSALPASGAVGSGTFVMNDPSNPLNVGILSSAFSLQGLSVFLVGQIMPNRSEVLENISAANNATLGKYLFPSPYALQLRIPISFPFSIDLGGGSFMNGTASGQFVANSPAPEPSTVGLTGLALLMFVAMKRRLQQR